jgi:hypothetical protein
VRRGCQIPCRTGDDGVTFSVTSGWRSPEYMECQKRRFFGTGLRWEWQNDEFEKHGADNGKLSPLLEPRPDAVERRSGESDSEFRRAVKILPYVAGLSVTL